MLLRPTVVTPAASQPLDWLAEVKQHLRLDTEEEQGRVMDVLVPAAAAWVESITGRALITQTWKLVGCGFPREVITLPRPPLQQVTAVRYRDSAGVYQTLDPATYVVDAPAGEKALPGRMYPVYGGAWPTPRGDRDAVEIEFTCGYGDDASAVPGGLRSAMLILVGELFERREQSIVGTIINQVPLTAEALAVPFMVEA